MKKTLILILGIILIFSLVGYIMYTMYNMRVTAVFEELEPFPKNINVYYRGFKFGRTVRVYPSEDFKTTYVDMILNIKGINLPDNVVAKVRTKNKKDFIEIEYPEAPSVTYLKNRSVIEGSICPSLSSYINAQAESGGQMDLCLFYWHSRDFFIRHKRVTPPFHPDSVLFCGGDRTGCVPRGM